MKKDLTQTRREGAKGEEFKAESSKLRAHGDPQIWN
jgi:hypothetical protein